MYREPINAFMFTFGVPAYYNGAGTSIKIIKNPDLLEYELNGTTIQNYQLTALCKSADLPNLARNKILNLGLIDYYIIDYEPLDNENLILCYLSRSTV